jgi:hypothetical protein
MVALIKQVVGIAIHTMKTLHEALLGIATLIRMVRVIPTSMDKNQRQGINNQDTNSQNLTLELWHLQ